METHTLSVPNRVLAVIGAVGCSCGYLRFPQVETCRALLAARGFEAGSRELVRRNRSRACVGDGWRNSARQSLARDLRKRFPLHTLRQSVWLPAIQGSTRALRKDSAASLTALQDAAQFDLGGKSCLYHVYIRGEAYLAGAQGSAAAAELQKTFDHSRIVQNCWTGAFGAWAWPCSRELFKDRGRERMLMPPAFGRSQPTKIYWRSGKTPTATPVRTSVLKSPVLVPWRPLTDCSIIPLWSLDQKYSRNVSF
jgi:hypothetical protein